MKKNKILLALIMALVCVLTLAGCKSDTVTVSDVFINLNDNLLVTSVPDDNFDSVNVFQLLSDEQKPSQVIFVLSDKTVISNLSQANFVAGTIKFDKAKDELVDQSNIKKGLVRTYTIEIKEYERGFSKVASIKMFLKGSESSGDIPMLLNVHVKPAALTHILGETFRFDEFIKTDSGLVTAVSVNSNGDVLDVTSDLKTADVDPKTTDTVRYSGGLYKIYVAYGDDAVVIPVNVVGGEVPINKAKNPGWFDKILTIPFGYLMAFLSFGGYFAVGIVLTTIVVRTIAWPVYASTNNMSNRMKLAGPDIQKLERKYQNRTDRESMQRKQMEMMQIYKKHKVNFLGCLTPLIQFPIFSAMWQLVRRIMAPGGMFNAQVTDGFILGVNLHSGSGSWDDIAHIILVVLVGITMAVLTKLGQMQPKYMKNTVSHQPKNEKQQQQEKTMKMMTWFMTIMMVVVSFTSNNAMSFYWIIGNIYSIGQNLLMKYLNKKKYLKTQPLDLI